MNDKALMAILHSVVFAFWLLVFFWMLCWHEHWLNQVNVGAFFGVAAAQGTWMKTRNILLVILVGYAVAVPFWIVGDIFWGPIVLYELFDTVPDFVSQ